MRNIRRGLPWWALGAVYLVAAVTLLASADVPSGPGRDPGRAVAVRGVALRTVPAHPAFGHDDPGPPARTICSSCLTAVETSGAPEPALRGLIGAAQAVPPSPSRAPPGRG